MESNVNDWLSAYIIIIFYVLFQNISSSRCVVGWVFPILWSLGCHIASIANLWMLWGSTFFVVLMVKKSRFCMICYKMFLWPLQEMWYFISCDNKIMSFHPLIYSFRVVELTLCYQSMMSARWQMLSMSIPFNLIWFWGLVFLMGLLQ